MLECEALCSRIAIQVSGSLQCIGTAAHLKHRFGKGYQIDINGTEELKQQVETFVRSSFSGVTLLEKHGARFKFRVDKSKTLAEMFRYEFVILGVQYELTWPDRVSFYTG